MIEIGPKGFDEKFMNHEMDDTKLDVRISEILINFLVFSLSFLPQTFEELMGKTVILVAKIKNEVFMVT